jgi:hypothetical protein
MKDEGKMGLQNVEVGMSDEPPDDKTLGTNDTETEMTSDF